MTTIPTYCSADDKIPEDYRDYEVYDRKTGLVLKDVVEADTNSSKPWARVYILDAQGKPQFDKWGAALTEIKHGDFEIRLSDYGRQRRDAVKQTSKLSYVTEKEIDNFFAAGGGRSRLPPVTFKPLSQQLRGSVTGRASAKDANGNDPGAAAPAPVVNGGVTSMIDLKESRRLQERYLRLRSQDQRNALQKEKQ